MEQILIRILNMSISASWLILAVLLLRPLLKKAPKWISCVLWGLAGLRLVLPFHFESILSLLPSKETIPENIIYAQFPAIHSGVPALNTYVNPMISGSLSPNPAASANPLQIIGFIGACIWLAGLIIALAYALISTLLLKRKLSSSICIQDNIFQSNAISIPFVFGIFRPRIYLPCHISHNDASYVVAHESAHIRRWDHVTKPIGFLILSVHWFNPLVWLAYSLFSKDIEFACDEHVIADYTASERKAYSLALLNCSVGHRRIAAQPLAFGETSIKKRIRNVIGHKRTPVWLTIICILLCVIFALCFLTDPVSVKTLTPIGGEYGVERVVYENGSYSFTMLPEYYPVFSVSADMELTTDDTDPIGILKETILTKENFDRSFRNSDIWHDESTSPSKLRRNNARAWTIVNGEHYYTLLQQKNGDLYLIQGNVTLNSGPSARWVFRLLPLSISIIGGADGPTSVYVAPDPSGITYRYQNTEEPIKPTLGLFPEESTFSFCYSGFSSYLGFGTYEEANDELTLRTDDEQNIYVFRRSGSNLVFDSARSSPIPSYANLPDGAVFEKE